MKFFFHDRYTRIVILAAVFMAPLVLGGARRALLSNKNDVKEWLPDSFDETVTYNWFRDHFEGEEFILVSWQGCTIDDQRLRLFEKKASQPAPPVAEEKLPPKHADAFIPLPGSTEPTPPIEDPRTRLFTEVISGASVLDRLQAPPLNVPRDQAIDRLRGALIGPDEAQTCAVLTLSSEGKEDLRGTLTAIYELADECAIGREAIHMGGPPVDNVAIDIEGERTLVRLAGLSAIAGLGLSWWCLRSGRLVAMVFSSALYAAALSMAVVWYTGGRMNSILLTMPSLIYVLAISSAIHIINYYRDAVKEGGLIGAPQRAIAQGWVPCTLAATTTALGLGSLYISHLIPIEQFGLYSAIATVATLAIVLWFLPALMVLMPLPVSAEAAEHADGPLPEVENRWNWNYVVNWLGDHKLAASMACLLLLAIGGFGLTRVKTSVQLMKLFSPEAKILQDYAWLEENLGPLVPMEVVVRIEDDAPLDFLERMQLVRRIQTQLETIPDLGGTLSAATFAPDLGGANASSGGRDYSAGGAMLGALQRIVTKNKANVEHEVRNKRLLAHRDEILDGDYVNVEEHDELWRISARVAALSDIDYSVYIHDIQRQVDPILQELDEQGVTGVSAVYTGLVPLVYQAQRSLLDGLVNSFAAAFMMIAVLMMVVLRSVRAGILSMIPNVFPAVVVFGTMGLLGIEIDIGSMMTASVALGVAVDDTLHFLTWFRRGIDRGLERVPAVKLAYAQCASAMCQTTLVGGVGLAIFAFSSFVPTQRFGYLMLTMLVAALVGDLILLPALLLSPLGKVFAKPRRPKKSSEGDAVPRSESLVPGGASHAPPNPHTITRRGIRL